MQAPSREITLDQLRAPFNETAEATSAESTIADPQCTTADNPLLVLDGMLRSLAPTETRNTIARRLAELAKQAVSMDLYLVMLVDQGQSRSASNERLSIRASAPDLSGQLLAVPPLETEAALWEKLRQSTTPGQLPMLNVREQEALNPLDNLAYGSLFIVPLVAGAQCLGLLYGYTSSVRDLAVHELLSLQAICGYAAMSLTIRSQFDASHPCASIQTFFDDLLADTPPQEDALRAQVTALGYDVTQPSVILMVEVAGMPGEHGRHVTQQKQGAINGARALFSRTLDYLHARIEEQFPCSLIDEGEYCLRCLIALPHNDDAARLATWLTALMRQIEGDYEVHLRAGISSVCSDSRDYPRGFVEAQEALQIGERLHWRDSYAGSASFDELGAYRYLYPFAREQRLSDTHLDQIETIASYDRQHKRGNLLRSLETYLALGGNIKEAAQQLGVHRNTLTQRLERIQSLCGVDLDVHRECFSLELALMIYRLR